MQTILSLLLLALTTGDALAAPAAISRPHWQEQTGDLDPFGADLAASTAALRSTPPASDSMLPKTYALAKRAEAAMLEADLTHVDVLPRNGDTEGEHANTGYAKRGARGRRLSHDSDLGGEEVMTRSLDDLLPDNEGLLLGREPRGIGKRLGVALGGGAFGAMMAQLGQALILGVDPIPLKSKRSLHDVRDSDEKEESMVQEKRAQPSFFDALARKLFEKFFTSGGGGVIYQPLRYKFRQIFGKAQHGHT